MRRCLSGAAVRAAERAAMATGAESEFSLLLRAGEALANAAERAMERSHTRDCLFVCGTGNNGGDGYAAARLLLSRGYEPACLALAPPKEGTAAAQVCAQFSGEVLGRMPRRRYAVIVDCLFGTGLSRAPEGECAALIDFINGSGAYVVACDLPSGLGAGGVAYAHAVRADETVTMLALKEELLLADGPDLAGAVTLADLGVETTGGAELWGAEDVQRLFPPKRSHSHKGSYGSVAILATCDLLGAPLLAVGAALRSGAGYTDLCMTSMSVPCDDGAEIAARRLEDELHRALCAAKYPACRFSFYDDEPLFDDAVAFGMGAGVSPAVKGILEELLSTYARGTLVLDADALNTLAVCGKEVLRKKKCPVVITPHIGEFARLTGKTKEEILRDPVGCAKAFSGEYGVTVVLKNNRTVIAEGERIAINLTGSPALAKGGSGDVLAGLLAGTCARGVPPFEAAAAACYLLGRAGELAAERMGEYAPDASDLLCLLPEVMRAL